MLKFSLIKIKEGTPPEVAEEIEAARVWVESKMKGVPIEHLLPKVSSE